MTRPTSTSPEHRDALLGRARDVDVGRVTAAGADRDQREVEDRALHRVALDHEEVRPLGLDALGELLGPVEAERAVVDPGVEDDVGAQLLERREAVTPEGRGHEGLRAIRHRGSLART